MFIIALATAGTVLTLNIYQMGENGKPVPDLLQKVFFKFIARVLFISVHISDKHKRLNRKITIKKLLEMNGQYDPSSGGYYETAFGATDDHFEKLYRINDVIEEEPICVSCGDRVNLAMVQSPRQSTTHRQPTSVFDSLKGLVSRNRACMGSGDSYVLTENYQRSSMKLNDMDLIEIDRVKRRQMYNFDNGRGGQPRGSSQSPQGRSYSTSSNRTPNQTANDDLANEAAKMFGQRTLNELEQSKLTKRFMSRLSGQQVSNYLSPNKNTSNLALLNNSDSELNLKEESTSTVDLQIQPTSSANAEAPKRRLLLRATSPAHSGYGSSSYNRSLPHVYHSHRCYAFNGFENEGEYERCEIESEEKTDTCQCHDLIAAENDASVSVVPANSGSVDVGVLKCYEPIQCPVPSSIISTPARQHSKLGVIKDTDLDDLSTAYRRTPKLARDPKSEPHSAKCFTTCSCRQHLTPTPGDNLGKKEATKSKSSRNSSLKQKPKTSPHDSGAVQQQQQQQRLMAQQTMAHQQALTSQERKYLCKLLKTVNSNLEKAECRQLEKEYKEEIRNQWTQLSKVVDIVLAYVFIIGTAFLLLFIINQAPNAKIF